MSFARRLGMLAALAAAAPAAAQVNAPATWAVLIGVEHYADANIGDAPYAADDAKVLYQTLIARGGCDPRRLLLLTDASAAEVRPTLANVRRQLAPFLKRAAPRDQVIVFFAGHSLRDKEDTRKTFIAPSDATRDPASGSFANCIPLGELRRALEECPAKSKLLILDTCHAGNARGTAIPASEPGALGRAAIPEEELGAFNGVYTIASCKADQQSVPFPAKEHGLFTFWLNEGLQGLADANGDGAITPDELFEFAAEAVEQSKASRGRQTPCRIIGPDAARTPILTLLPEKEEGPAFDRVANYVSEICLRNDVKLLAIAPEFGLSDGLRTQYVNGGYGRQAAAEVSRRIVAWAQRAKSRGRPTYDVLDSETVRREFGKKPSNPERLELLGSSTKADAVLMGELTYLSTPATVRKAAKLSYRITKTANAAQLSTFVSLTPVQPAAYVELTGKSAVVPPAQFKPDMDSIRWHGQYRRWMDLEAGKAHPLFNPNLPYKVEIRSNGRTLPTYFDRADPTKVYVTGRPGERFQIYIANRTGSRGAPATGYGYGYGAAQPVAVGNPGGYNGDLFVRVFVDGLNVLGAKPEMPDKAWPFLSEPQSDYLIAGFHYPKVLGAGQQEWEVRPFVFTEAANSLAAARGGDARDVGTINVFFSAATEMNWLRALGATEDENVRLRVLFPSGRGKEQLCDAYPLAMITIHYVQAPD